MYFFLFDSIAPPSAENGKADGYAIVWVDNARHSAAKRAALEFADRQGWTIRAVRSTHKATQDDLERLSLEELATRVRGMREGGWGYFVAHANAETGSVKLRLVAKPARYAGRGLILGVRTA
jgi:hypothetical protein